MYVMLLLGWEAGREGAYVIGGVNDPFLFGEGMLWQLVHVCVYNKWIVPCYPWLKARKKSAPEGSYTKRLFDDPDLLRKKLLEEAQELIEAQTPDEVASEAADVLYFAMVR